MAHKRRKTAAKSKTTRHTKTKVKTDRPVVLPRITHVCAYPVAMKVRLDRPGMLVEGGYIVFVPGRSA